MVETTGLTGVLRFNQLSPPFDNAGIRRAACCRRLKLQHGVEKARSRVPRQFGEHLLNPVEVEAGMKRMLAPLAAIAQEMPATMLVLAAGLIDKHQ